LAIKGTSLLLKLSSFINLKHFLILRLAIFVMQVWYDGI
jgi:hypothetical protein